jgi:hypothetical protein
MNHEFIDDNKPLRFTATEEKNATTEELKKFFAKRFYLRGDIKIGDEYGWDCKEAYEQLGFNEAEAMNLTQGISLERTGERNELEFHSTYSKDLWRKFTAMEMGNKYHYIKKRGETIKIKLHHFYRKYGYGSKKETICFGYIEYGIKGEPSKYQKEFKKAQIELGTKDQDGKGVGKIKHYTKATEANDYCTSYYTQGKIHEAFDKYGIEILYTFGNRKNSYTGYRGTAEHLKKTLKENGYKTKDLKGLKKMDMIKILMKM